MKQSELKPGTVFRYADGGPTQFYVVPWDDSCPLSRRGLLAGDPDTKTKRDADVEVVWAPDGGPTDPVDRPSHYVRLKPEPLDVIQKWGLSFARGSAVKYIARAGHKEGASEATDLRKAIALLQKEVARLEVDE